MDGKKAFFTLESVPSGAYTVISLGGGMGFIRRLADLGIYPGVRLSVISNQKRGGPIILSVKGSRVGIGRGMAARIYVEKV
jgi:Fe2+ transport system protein FeoA